MFPGLERGHSPDSSKLSGVITWLSAATLEGHRSPPVW